MSSSSEDTQYRVHFEFSMHNRRYGTLVTLSSIHIDIHLSNNFWVILGCQDVVTHTLVFSTKSSPTSCDQGDIPMTQVSIGLLLLLCALYAALGALSALLHPHDELSCSRHM